MRSLRLNLLRSLLWGVAIVGIAGSWFAYRNALAQADDFFDYQLQQTALLVRDQAYQFILPPAARSARASHDFVVQVWTPQGVSMFLSESYDVVPGIAPNGFSDATVGGEPWRIFALHTREGIIQVAQPMRVRESLARSAAFRSLAPFMLLVPVMAVLIWLAVGRSLRPVADLASNVAHRSPAVLDPLPEASLPEEIAPLVRAMNALLERLRAAIERERAFLSDAAHELRTPLTALALQIEALSANPGSPSQSHEIAHLASGVRRASRLVEQLLALAREDSAGTRPTSDVSLDEVAREVVADTLPFADQRGIDLGIEETARVTLRGDEQALRTLVRNLVDNAVRYTPRGGHVDVRIREQTSGNERSVVLEVSDTGPGIPAPDRERVFERFQRLSGSDEPGSGLGLAIVKAIATAHRGRVTLQDGPAGSGLTVRVEFLSSAAP